MDQGDGSFKMVDEQAARELLDNRPKERERIFRIGEEVQIRSSRFRITHIKERGDMRLKLLPKSANNAIPADTNPCPVCQGTGMQVCRPNIKDYRPRW